jgi:hypothetical protein
MTARQTIQKEKSKGEKKKKKRNMIKVVYFRTDGKPYNMNEGGWDFELAGQMEESEPYLLDFGCYKHLDTDSIDLDVQPHYVRITIRDKVLQLHLLEEVAPDSGKAERSKATGRLLGTMPKVTSLLAPKKRASQPAGTVGRHGRAEEGKRVLDGAGAAAARSGRGLRQRLLRREHHRVRRRGGG